MYSCSNGRRCVEADISNAPAIINHLCTFELHKQEVVIAQALVNATIEVGVSWRDPVLVTLECIESSELVRLCFLPSKILTLSYLIQR